MLKAAAVKPTRFAAAWNSGRRHDGEGLADQKDE